MCLLFFLFQAKIIDWLYNRFRNVRSVQKSKSKRKESEDSENEGDDNTDHLGINDEKHKGKDNMQCDEVIGSPNGLCETIYVNATGEICSYVDESEIISEGEYSLSFENKPESELAN